MKTETPVFALPLLRGLHQSPKLCQYNSWCFGKAYFVLDNHYQLEINGQSVEIIAPGWACIKCGETEATDEIAVVIYLKALEVLEKGFDSKDTYLVLS